MSAALLEQLRKIGHHATLPFIPPLFPLAKIRDERHERVVHPLSSTRAGSAPAPARPSLAEASRFWLKLGLISFGGPAGQIAIMHAELVERRKWIGEARFLHALNYCLILPGPEAQQLAIYCGWLLHRTRGGLIAGLLFVLPSALLLWLLSVVYVWWGQWPWIAAIFAGLKPAVLAIVASALLRLGKKALRNGVMWTLAGLAFAALYFCKMPFPAVMLAAAVIGLIGGKWWREKFLPAQDADCSAQAKDDLAESSPPTWGRALRVIAVCGVLWWTPILLLGGWLGWDHALFREGVFFSKAAMTTFGGAYAVLPYVSQQAVEHYGWLGTGQMLDGLGLAETTPGPLIMVLQFVGFLGGWHQPGPLPPLLAATLGAGITTWTTFLPCFLWIFLGAPHLDQLRGNIQIATVLPAITAAVVGVILNLAVWSGRQVLFPAPATVDWLAVTVAALAFIGLQRWKWGVVPVILGAGVLGLLCKLCG